MAFPKNIGKIMMDVDDFVDGLHVPFLNIDLSERKDLNLAGLSNATNEQLEEYLDVFGGYKSFLEGQLGVVESKRGVLDEAFDEGLFKMYFVLTERYRNEGAKVPTKETLRGQALSENTSLKEIREKLIEMESICKRVQGLKDSYASAFNTISRIVALRSTMKDQS